MPPDAAPRATGCRLRDVIFRRRAFRAAGLVAAALVLAGGGARGAEVDRSTLLSRELAHEWRAVGRVNVAGARDRSQCTGTLIAPDLVLTAAHCLLHPGTGEPWPAGNVHFVAGWYGGEMTGHSRAAALAVAPGYDPRQPARASVSSDIGLIRLAEPLTAAQAPPFTVAAAPEAGTPVTLVSYRRDRAHAPTLQDDCRYRARDADLLLLACPVTFGASGAPLFAGPAGARRVVGVVSAMGEGGTALAVRADALLDRLLPLLAE